VRGRGLSIFFISAEMIYARFFSTLIIYSSLMVADLILLLNLSAFRLFRLTQDMKLLKLSSSLEEFRLLPGMRLL